MIFVIAGGLLNGVWVDALIANEQVPLAIANSSVTMFLMSNSAYKVTNASLG
ncbi:MAG: hypothetical protein AB8B99_22150 [Phormidesmis sp.]